MNEICYLEIIEQLTEDESLTKEPQTVRVQVKDEAEARALLPKYEPDFKGLNYIKRFHIHKHAAAGGLPCKVIPL